MRNIHEQLVILSWAIHDYAHDFYCAVSKYPGRTFLKCLAPYSEHAEWLLTMYIHIDQDRWWIKFNREDGEVNAAVLQTCTNIHNELVRLYNERKYWFLDAKEYFNKD